jgi:hypothetical protein
VRTTFIALMVLLPGAAIVNACFCGASLQAFLRDVSGLASSADLERFKRVVAGQMYAALVQLVLLAVPPILYAVGLAKGVLVGGDIVYILVPSAVVILVAQTFKKLETRVKTIPATDADLARQRDAIVHTWMKKPLPDW